MELSTIKRRLEKVEAGGDGTCRCQSWPVASVEYVDDPGPAQGPAEPIPATCPRCGRPTPTQHIRVEYVDDPEGVEL